MAMTPFRPVRVGMSSGTVRPGSNLAQQLSVLENNFRSWVLHLTGQSGEVLREALQPTLVKAKKYCPVLTGELRESGYLEVRRTGPLGSYQAEIGFAKGGKPSYAIYVHEVPYNHRSPTRWKFLQAALEEDATAIRARLTTGFKRSSGT